ncbi:MAG: aminotransferase class IV [Gammaproteobacteria bacterium]
MPKLASYNGKVDSIENIKVSPMSRAFLFSDSVYEVISFYKNEFIDFETHLDRLKHSLNETQISCSIEDCKTEIEKLLSESKSEDGYIYFQVSRGVDSKRSHFFEESDCERFGFVEEFSFFNQSPLRVMLVDDIRWQRCDIKSTSLLGNVLQMNDAKSMGCNEILMHKNGELTEGGASNIFFVKDKTIHTPELSSNILPGITRQQVIKIIKDKKLDFQEGSYSINDLNEASSIWFTSTTKGIVGVEEIANLETKINPECELLEICKDAFVKKYFS